MISARWGQKDGVAAFSAYPLLYKFIKISLNERGKDTITNSSSMNRIRCPFLSCSKPGTDSLVKLTCEDFFFKKLFLEKTFEIVLISFSFLMSIFFVGLKNTGNGN